MGGNAIKSSERFSTPEMEFIVSVLRVTLAHSGVRMLDTMEVVPSYTEKPDHGDLDVLVDSRKVSKEWLLTIFEDYEVVKNGDVISVGFEVYFNNDPSLPLNTTKMIQVDFIFVEDMESALHYFSYNDLGNLMGRIAHKKGFKLGHEGLKYVFRDGTHAYSEVVVSRDWRTIFSFLGLNYERYLEGFNTLEDIFKFVSSSRFFNADIYLLHNVNNTSRTRDRKRKTYMEFLNWCRDRKFDNNYPWEVEDKEKEVQKELLLHYSFGYLEGWRELYEKETTKHEEQKKFKAWWNGELVRGVTGLEGKELGEFMKWCKGAFNLESAYEAGIDAVGYTEGMWKVYNDEASS